MSTTPNSEATISFFGPPDSVAITAKAGDEYTWLTFGHEVIDEEENPHRLPSRCAVEVAVWGSPEELHAFALRLVAAIEAEWEIECPAAGLMHRVECSHERAES